MVEFLLELRTHHCVCCRGYPTWLELSVHCFWLRNYGKLSHSNNSVNTRSPDSPAAAREDVASIAILVGRRFVIEAEAFDLEG